MSTHTVTIIEDYENEFTQVTDPVAITRTNIEDVDAFITLIEATIVNNYLYEDHDEARTVFTVHQQELLAAFDTNDDVTIYDHECNYNRATKTWTHNPHRAGGNVYTFRFRTI